MSTIICIYRLKQKNMRLANKEIDYIISLEEEHASIYRRHSNTTKPICLRGTKLNRISSARKLVESLNEIRQAIPICCNNP